MVICGIMQHIEQAGVHSGDSACSIPPQTISEECLATIREWTPKLARALKVVGLINIQYAVQDNQVRRARRGARGRRCRQRWLAGPAAGRSGARRNSRATPGPRPPRGLKRHASPPRTHRPPPPHRAQVYIIEANPRASRTVPFVAKAIGHPLAAYASLVMSGKKLADLGFTEVRADRGVLGGWGACGIVRWTVGVDGGTRCAMQAAVGRAAAAPAIAEACSPAHTPPRPLISRPAPLPRAHPAVPRRSRC